MQKVLDYVSQEKLGAAVLPPFKQFSGLLAAKIKRHNGATSFIVSKWNPEKETPDVAYDPNAFQGQVSEFIELYQPVSAGSFYEDEDDAASMTIPQIMARLIELGMPEADAKKLGNKQAKFDKMQELEAELESENNDNVGSGKEDEE